MSNDKWREGQNFYDAVDEVMNNRCGDCPSAPEAGDRAHATNTHKCILTHRGEETRVTERGKTEKAQGKQSQPEPQQFPHQGETHLSKTKSTLCFQTQISLFILKLKVKYTTFTAT